MGCTGSTVTAMNDSNLALVRNLIDGINLDYIDKPTRQQTCRLFEGGWGWELNCFLACLAEQATLCLWPSARKTTGNGSMALRKNIGDRTMRGGVQCMTTKLR